MIRNQDILLGFFISYFQKAIALLIIVLDQLLQIIHQILMKNPKISAPKNLKSTF